jgi:hypothetical protein
MVPHFLSAVLPTNLQDLQSKRQFRTDATRRDAEKYERGKEKGHGAPYGGE